jgi:hypothetical protein
MPRYLRAGTKSSRRITPIEAAWAHLPAPNFPNDAAGSDGPDSWNEEIKISGNNAEIEGMALVQMKAGKE